MRQWRKATWALALWGLLVAVQLVTAFVQIMTDTSNGTGVLRIVGWTVLGLIGFVILSLLWLMSRPQKRLCPRCGKPANEGTLFCSRCGYNFAQGLAPAR